MNLISDEIRTYLSGRFQQELQKPVTLDLFTRGDYLNPETDKVDHAMEIGEEEACRLTLEMMNELSALAGENVQVAIHDVDKTEGEEAAKARGVNANLLPALSFAAEGMAGKSYYYGLPSGYEFGTLIENLIVTSQAQTELSQKTRDKLGTITTPVSILVFVTPT